MDNNPYPQTLSVIGVVGEGEFNNVNVPSLQLKRGIVIGILMYIQLRIKEPKTTQTNRHLTLLRSKD